MIETEAPAIGGRALAEWVRERQAFQSDSLLLKPAPTSLVPVAENHADRSVIDIEMIPEAAADIDHAALQRAFRQADGNIAAAARSLGIHRATYYRYLKRLNLGREDLSV